LTVYLLIPAQAFVGHFPMTFKEAPGRYSREQLKCSFLRCADWTIRDRSKSARLLRISMVAYVIGRFCAASLKSGGKNGKRR
jgi:hypothetical protein